MKDLSVFEIKIPVMGYNLREAFVLPHRLSEAQSERLVRTMHSLFLATKPSFAKCLLDPSLRDDAVIEYRTEYLDIINVLENAIKLNTPLGTVSDTLAGKQYKYITVKMARVTAAVDNVTII